MRKLYLFLSAALALLGAGQAVAQETTEITMSLTNSSLNRANWASTLTTNNDVEPTLTFVLNPDINNLADANTNGVVQWDVAGRQNAFQATLSLSDATYYISSVTFRVKSGAARDEGGDWTFYIDDATTVYGTDYTDCTWTNTTNDKTKRSLAIKAGNTLAESPATLYIENITVTVTKLSDAYIAAYNVYNENKDKAYPSSDGVATLGYKADKVTAFNNALAHLGTLLEDASADDTALTDAANAVTNAAVTEADYVSTPTDFTDKIAKVGAPITDASGIVPGNWYTLYNGRAYGGYTGGYWTDSEPKVVGGNVKMSNGKGVIGDLTTVVEAAPYLVRFVETSTGGVYHLQFATGNYAGSVGTIVDGTRLVTATEANADDLHVYTIADSKFALNKWTGSDGPKVDNNGSGNEVTYWGDGTNDGTSTNNIWTIYPVTLSTDFLPPYNAVKSEYQAKVTEWANNVNDSELFYPNSAKVAGMQSLLTNIETPTSIEDAEQKLAAFAEAIVVEKAVNLPADGNYFFVNDYYTEHLMSAAIGHNTNVRSDRPGRTVWHVEANGEGKYSIRNHVTDEYLQQPSSGQQVKASSTPYYFTMIPAPNGHWGKVSFGADAVLGNQNKLHEDGYEKVVGWDATSKATHWTIEAVDETALSQATTAETELVAGEAASVNKMANALKVSIIITSLKQYIDGLDYAPVYTAAQDKIYRFVKTAGGTSLGLKAGTSVIPAAVATNPKDLGQLWRMVYIESTDGKKGVKLVNLNAFAENEGVSAIAPLNEANPNNYIDASFTSVNGGALFQIADANDDGNFRIENNGNKMNVEGTGIINYWNDGGNSHRFTAVVVEDIEIGLNAAGENTWASAYLPFGVSEANDDIELFVGTLGSGSVTVNTTDNVAAKNGFVVKGKNGVATATLTIDNNAVTTSDIGGSTVATTVDDANRSSIYVFGKNSSGKVGFYNLSSATGIAANRAFINTTSATVNGFVLNFDEATAIERVEAAPAEGVVYDLSGRRVSKATKGIFIVNGKKVIR